MSKTFEQKLAEAQAEVPSISPREASRRRIDDPDILFIDPRSLEDIHKTTGKIPGALSVPLDDLDTTGEVGLPRELGSRVRTIITACQGGPMGALAAHALKRRGYNDVAYVDGGTQGWLDAGFVTER